MICCDAPAKSYILKIKSNSGYASCTRCTIYGEYFSSVCFTYTSQKPARSHENYINKTDEDHHISDKVSVITDIPNLDVIKCFPLDYMHLVVLGVMRKLILFWISKGPLSVRISSRSTNQITLSLLSIKKYITSDFVRKPREIQEICRWKATELRLFLIYILDLLCLKIFYHGNITIISIH